MAEEVQHTSQPAAGYVSVTGAVSVNDLTAQLAKKLMKLAQPHSV